MSDVLQIIPFYAHPHVHTVINDNSFYDEATGTPDSAVAELPFSTIVITGADTGIDNTLVKLTDASTKAAIFGKGDFKKYGQSSLQCDFLFNRSTNVWFMRVLPDNATYANMVIVAKYRMGDELDDMGEPSGLKRMEIKFETKFAAKPTVTNGANSDDIIKAFAKTFKQPTADAQTGYRSTPIAYVRSIGRGRYGNAYGMRLSRDVDAEKEYDLKMYRWSLVTNVGSRSRVSNIFTGSLYQTVRYDKSTLISDVLDQFSTGSCPVSIYPFEDEFFDLYDFYQEVISRNEAYIGAQDEPSEEDLENLARAKSVTIEGFDPLFGYELNTISDEIIPYYQNYTVRGTGYIEPDKTVETAARIPRNIGRWTEAAVGDSLLVQADENNGGYRWRYNIIGINEDNGNITYDEGYQEDVDADQYDGADISASAGIRFIGGHDGDFQEISVDGVTREPNEAEMKLLLAREQVKAFRGKKDSRIISPARIDLDFIFDANYNMTSTTELLLDDSIEAVYSNSTVLSSDDYVMLSTVGSSSFAEDLSDINVKQAIYDLNVFRNKNGMTINPEMGAGCSVYFDCGLVGIDSKNMNRDIANIITDMDAFDGRACSIDLGYYKIYDPYTGRKITVTTSYFIATNLVNHMLRYGINKPFAMRYATMNTIRRYDGSGEINAMIQGTFHPDIDMIDWDVKEKLYVNRINYWITSNEGRSVARNSQNTRQREASALLEENNVRVLNTLKKGLESACRGYLYEWNDPTARKSYTDVQMKNYESWQGTMVEDLNIFFDANEWEQTRMIMHCYVSVKFRGIVKRVILEININQ